MPLPATADLPAFTPAGSFRHGWHRRLIAAHPAAKWLIAVTGTAAVAYADFISGDAFSISIFYVLPIAFASWFLGLGSALLVVFLCAVIWSWLELTVGASVEPMVLFWNGTVRLVFFVITVFAVTLVKRTESQLLREVLRRTRTLRTEAERRRRLEREMVEVTAREQVRMAQDLHDGLGQYLSALSFHARILADDLQQHGSPHAAQAERIVALIRTTNQITRQLDRAMRVPEAEHGDFCHKIRMLISDLEQLTGVRCELDAPTEQLVLDEFRSVMVFRIVQEALNNAIKHATPRLVRVKISNLDDELTVVVLDDGRGLPDQPEREVGSGIRVMKLRAELLGARLNFSSGASGGCEVRCVLPLGSRVAAGVK